MTKFTSVAEYFKSVDDPKHLQDLQKLHDIIQAAAPKASELISYNMPAFKQNDKVLVYYAANKTKLGFYPTAEPMVEFADQLKDYSTSKGAVQFDYDRPLPKKLITEMVKSRIKATTPKFNDKTYKFNAVIKASEVGKGGAYVIFPYDIKQEFGKGRVKVDATFDGIPYSGSIVNMGVKNDDGSICYILGILKSIREKLNKSIGDTVSVTVKEQTLNKK